ncbi:glycine zipper 2TM domain-containing protein [Alysiella crassa]|uniref:Lipoprotein n=1 Tax=Alysiella crassa TaxID=153491 RepID=A0A376BNZ8_9NEIS|nr:glycine zipper 2TM domain-containing protein [Alysiella crassa]UOP06934.1 glycine zipper 2TM domain-containing protein [Alysiella crassa]SSY70934.1 lipoprotein [Alysiella crassa]
MNTISKTLALVLVSASLAACTTNGMTTSQRNAAIGAVVGGAAGNLIGGDTGATLGGAALGGVIGSQIK